jgi:hypothetical protein
MLLAPVLQLAIFTSTAFLDKSGMPTKTNKENLIHLPDVEIMPVSRQSQSRSREVIAFLLDGV